MSRILSISLFIRCSLFSIMLAMQGLALAHEIDHFSADDTATCASCALGHSLDSPVVENSSQGDAIGAQNFSFPIHDVQPAQPAGHEFCARAPPNTL